MSDARDIWAVVPIKEANGAKQRLSALLTEEQRRKLAATMAEDVLDALSQVRSLAGILVVTLDPAATRLAERFGARVVTDGARDGHTGAVTAAARLLCREGRGGMLQVPGDIPRITAAEVETVLAEHRSAPSFTIAAAHDERGSNAVLLTPPDVMPLRFGDDSFFPHLATARAHGIEPTVLHLPGIGMDIDHPVDLAMFLRMTPRLSTRTLAWLEEAGVARVVLDSG
ncbi:MAG: 2-phospho-L-lactate guanylyltransferase [Alphaproteobacteria bacterium]|nr:2-phospho-L-lactate guanylyltransferase [Alphaproteobacteria bacterium]